MRKWWYTNNGNHINEANKTAKSFCVKLNSDVLVHINNIKEAVLHYKSAEQNYRFLKAMTSRFWFTKTKIDLHKLGLFNKVSFFVLIAKINYDNLCLKNYKKQKQKKIETDR